MLERGILNVGFDNIIIIACLRKLNAYRLPVCKAEALPPFNQRCFLITWTRGHSIFLCRALKFFKCLTYENVQGPGAVPINLYVSRPTTPDIILHTAGARYPAQGAADILVFSVEQRRHHCAVRNKDVPPRNC